MIRGGIIGGILFGLLLMQGSIQPAHAEGTASQKEATVFFAELAKSNNNPFIQAYAKENLSRLQGEKTERSMYTGRQVEVPLLLQNNNTLAVHSIANGRVMGTFLVDTGSTYTVITPRMARRIGVKITPETPRVSIITANGYVSAPKVTLDELTVGRLTVKNVEVVVQDLGDDILLAGLVGMNFFQGMDLTVKREKLIISMR